jgi:glycosidase
MPIARAARDRLAVAPSDRVATDGFGTDLATTRRLGAAIVARQPGAPALAGELAAIGLLHRILHLVSVRLAERDPAAGLAALARATAERAGRPAAEQVGAAFDREFPLAAAGAPPLEELLLVRVANENPAAGPYRWLFDDRPVVDGPVGERLLAAIEAAAADGPAVGEGGEKLLELLRAPALAAPTSLVGQLRFVRERWRGMLGADVDALLDEAALLVGVIDEEERALHQRFGGPGGPGTPEAPGLGDAIDPVRFSEDRDWMPRLVLIAKSTHVWLDQLSRRYGRDIRTLDAIPDEELDTLARWGVTGLWLIGLWERSRASERIKRMRGNPEAAASAYSLDDYAIATELGGEPAWANLSGRAWSRGIRLASDMVPNHMGIDSRWVIRYPERFLSLAEPPYPAYSFGGPDLSDDDRVAVRIEDHYWEGTDAAVVFQRVDTATGDVRYIYHGNDGTSMPWNDTAQLDYSRAEVREAVIATILDVARRFPIIRFDAAMTLAKRHVQRLWFPTPGATGSIPSRAERAMPREAFEAAMPQEFWREVVDRVAAEAPDTLLLAEAFWLMEGYFVRTLGMHRVYNSAFMHMLRDEDDAGYRKAIRDTLEFDPEILKRYVNFMNNPDERTAVEQFGKGDKYLGIATVMATLPGLPMLGHGQVEGFSEKYGMEYRRAYRDETPDQWLVEQHERYLFPLFHRRAQFAEVRDFRLYDLIRDDGAVEEHVYAYSNGHGPSRSLVAYHNRFAETAGRIHGSVAYATPDGAGGTRLARTTLGEAWGLPDDPAVLVRARDLATGLEHLWSAATIRARGLRLELRAYERRVLLDVAEVRDDSAGRWSALAERLGGAGVPSLEREFRLAELAPVHAAAGSLLGDLAVLGLVRGGRAPALGALAAPVEGLGAVLREVGIDVDPNRWRSVAEDRLVRIAALAAGRPALTPPELADPAGRAALAGWSLLEPLDRHDVAEALLLEPVIAGAFAHAGLERAAAATAGARVGRLLALRSTGDLPAATTGEAPAMIPPEAPLEAPAGPGATGDPTALAVLDAWTAGPAATLIGLNRWDGVDWVDRDGWDETVRWAYLLALVDGVDPDRAARMRDELTAAGEAAGCRLDEIRRRLATSDAE